MSVLSDTLARWSDGLANLAHLVDLLDWRTCA
jgi:hypothetical protein